MVEARAADSAGPLLSGLVELTPIGLALVDRSSREVVFSNPAAVTLMGRGALPGQRFPLNLGLGKHVLPPSEVELSGLQVEIVPFAPASRKSDSRALDLVVLQEHQDSAWSSQDTERLAFEDTLTGLPNLNILRQFIEFTCTQTHRYGRSASLLLLGIDQFQSLQRELGQTAGDDLLCQMATRLQQAVRSSDIVGRHSPDKFIIILTELTSDRSKEREGQKELPVPQRAATVAERLVLEFSKPFEAQSNPLHLQVSMGVSLCPGDASTPQEFLEHAELALAQTRVQDGKHFLLYSPAHSAHLAQQQQLAERLQRQLSEDRVEFCLEPLLDHGNPKPTAIMLKPMLEGSNAEFPDSENQPAHAWEVAESVDLGPQMFAWLLQANKKLARELPQQPGVISLILPVLPRQLLNADLGALLVQFREQVGPSVSQVILRIPEIAIATDLRKRMQAVKRLQELGFVVLLETGPRGLQSLPVLQQLRPTYLELPRSLTAGLPEDTQSALMVQACCQVARQFGVEVIARGVESEAQRSWLAEQGCHKAVGPAWCARLTVEELQTRLI